MTDIPDFLDDTSLLPTNTPISIPSDSSILVIRETISNVYRTIAEKIGPHNENLDNDPFFSKKTITALTDLGGPASVYAVLYAGELFTKSENKVSKSRAQGCWVLAGNVLEVLLERREEGVPEREVLWEALLKPWKIDSAEKSALDIATRAEARHFLVLPSVQSFVQALWKAGKKISDPMLVDSSLPTRKAKFKRITEIITTPRFQNATTVIMNFAFLALYTYVINCTDYKSGAPSITEWLLYLWAFGFLIQEFNKMREMKSMYFRIPSSYITLSFPSILFLAFIVRVFSITFSFTREPIFAGFDLLSLTSLLLYANTVIWLDSNRACGKAILVFNAMVSKSLWFLPLILAMMVGTGQAIWAAGKGGVAVESVLIFSTLLSSFTGKLLIAYTAIATLLLVSLLIASFSACYNQLVPSLEAEYALYFTRKTTGLFHSVYVFPPPSNVMQVIVRKVSQHVLRKRNNLVWIEHTAWWIMFAAFVICVVSWEIGLKMIRPAKQAMKKSYTKLRTWLHCPPLSSSSNPPSSTLFSALLQMERLKDIIEPEERALNRDLQLGKIVDTLLRIETKLHEFDFRIETLERLSQERHLSLDTKLTSLESVFRIQHGTLTNVNQMQLDTVGAVTRVEKNIVERLSKVEDTQIEGIKKLEHKQMEIEKKIRETLPKMIEKEVEVEKRLDMVEHVVVRQDIDNETVDWFGRAM